MIIWLSYADATAASYGLGGQLVSSLHRSCGQTADDDLEVRLEYAKSIHDQSNPLFQSVWGEDYPNSELLDDLENRKIFNLYCQSGQLRYRVAQIATLLQIDPESARRRAVVVKDAIWSVRAEYGELLELATTLGADSSQRRRLISNIRFIVPHYHAVVLEFYRVTDFLGRINNEQQLALREIINLAFQSYKFGGDGAILRIPWPLLLAGLETDDFVHREWIVERFKSLGVFGNNYKRALQLLDLAIV